MHTGVIPSSKYPVLKNLYFPCAYRGYSFIFGLSPSIVTFSLCIQGLFLRKEICMLKVLIFPVHTGVILYRLNINRPRKHFPCAYRGYSGILNMVYGGDLFSLCIQGLFLSCLNGCRERTIFPVHTGVILSFDKTASGRSYFPCAYRGYSVPGGYRYVWD